MSWVLSANPTCLKETQAPARMTRKLDRQFLSVLENHRYRIDVQPHMPCSRPTAEYFLACELFPTPGHLCRIAVSLFNEISLQYRVNHQFLGLAKCLPTFFHMLFGVCLLVPLTYLSSFHNTIWHRDRLCSQTAWN